MWPALLAAASLAATTPTEAPPTDDADALAVVDDEAGDSAAPVEAPPAGAPFGRIPPEVLRAVEASRHLPLPQRMAAVSEPLLGRPYVLDPLGEGVPPDPDPLVRYDAFDCLTFVEEVLALSLAGDPLHAAEIRNALRYGDAPVDYVKRRHFMELQWIAGNIADGWLVDTTREYGETIRLEREVTPATWAGWSRRARFAHEDHELPTGTMALDVLPLDVAREIAHTLRPGSLILTVREDRPWVPLWVTHIGFVLPGDPPRVRHATPMGGGGTRDQGLAGYLSHIAGYGGWKVLGIAVLEPVEPGPRALRP